MENNKYEKIFKRLPDRDESLNVWISAINKAFLLQICQETHYKLGELVEELLTALREGRLEVKKNGDK